MGKDNSMLWLMLALPSAAIPNKTCTCLIVHESNLSKSVMMCMKELITYRAKEITDHVCYWSSNELNLSPFYRQKKKPKKAHRGKYLG